MAFSENPYKIRWSIFSSGERMPFLVPAATGVPLDAPTFWIAASRRPMGHQPNTLLNELRSLMYLYLWSDARGVGVEERLRDGEFFTLSEILDITNFCSRNMQDAIAEVGARLKNVVNLDRRREIAGRSAQPDEKRNRLAAIYSFVDFTSSDIHSNLQSFPARWEHYNAVKIECLRLLKGYIKGSRKKSRDDLDLPEGLEATAIKRLREVIEPDHPDNPFKPEVRFRNYVIIRLLLDLGIRRGELLGLKVTDFELGSVGKVTIHRRPDDPDDPRAYKPASKTLARTLHLSPRNAELVHELIVHYRSKIPGARRHPFLVVSSVDGAPMSLSNINKILISLRQRVPGLPEELSPHVLRHSWNDEFSETATREGISPEDEAKWRARLMGWRSLASAAHYLRRTVRRRSNEVLMEMQEAFTITVLGDQQ